MKILHLIAHAVIESIVRIVRGKKPSAPPVLPQFHDEPMHKIKPTPEAEKRHAEFLYPIRHSKSDKRGFFKGMDLRG